MKQEDINFVIGKIDSLNAELDKWRYAAILRRQLLNQAIDLLEDCEAGTQGEEWCRSARAHLSEHSLGDA